MSTPPQYLRLKVGKRYWTLCVLQGVAPPADFGILTSDSSNPDLLLILEMSNDLRQQWTDAVINQHNEEWKVQFISNIQILSLHESFSGPSLIVGPQRLVSRFCNSAFLRKEEQPEIPTSSKASQLVENDIPAQDFSWRSRSYPELPDPTDIQRFSAEGAFDPFGQNQQLRENAWSAVASYIGRLAESAHREGFAVTLPPSPPGVAEPYLKPWRTVVPLELPHESAQSVILTKEEDLPSPSEQSHPSAHTGTARAYAVLRLFNPQLLKTLHRPPQELNAPTMQPIPDSDELSSKLDMFQRCLVTLANLSHEAPQAANWQDAASALEDLGYLLLSDNVDIEEYPPEVWDYFERGALLARLHEKNVIYADAHPGNMLFPYTIEEYQKRSLGERALICDGGGLFFPDRPITTLERAKNLAIMKMHCDLIQWEAVKLGYRFKAPKEAEKVFQFI